MGTSRSEWVGSAGPTGMPPLVQRAPLTPRGRESVSYRLLVLVFRPVWGWRLELATAAVGLGLWAWLVDVLGLAGHVFIAVLAGLLWVPPLGRLRRWLVRPFVRARLRRQWESAARHAGLATLNDRIPTLAGVEPTLAGELLRVRLPLGSSVRDLEDAADTVAAALGVREVTVTRDRANARYATVAVVRRDPFDRLGAATSPLATAPSWSLWEPVPVGVDEHGRPVAVSLPERNVLLGGEPGAGKSVAQSLLVAAAALDPGVDLTLLDGKQVELAPWAGCAAEVVGPDIAHAVEVVEALRTLMDDRYQQLLAAGRRKVAPGDGLRLQLVVVDELAYFLTMGERKDCAAFATGLRDLVSRGRAAGIIVVAATQKPSHEIVPTALRDLFAFRWALRCTTPQASDTVVGASWASLGYSAATIDPAMRGVGLLLHEGGVPVRCRSHLLDDDAIADVAARATALRSTSTTTSSGSDVVSWSRSA